MKLKKDLNVIQFLNDIKQCRQDVFFVTPEGDRLNLCSQLSEYVFLAAAINEELISRGIVELKDPADFCYISEYIVAPDS